MIYNVSKKSGLLFAFLLLLVFSSSIYAATAKPDLAFDINQTYSKKDSTVSDANIIQFKVKNAGVGTVFKNSNSYFNVKCTDKNSKIISEDKYKGTMTSITTKKVFVKKSGFPVTCKIDGENKIAETNENNNIFTFNFVSSSSTSSNTNTTKPDLILSSVSLDPNYPTPKVNDENIYLKFTIKNLGKSIIFSSSNKAIFGCNEMSNGKFLISKEIKTGTLGKDESLTFEGITNVPDSSIYLIPPQTGGQYKLNCRILLSSNNESSVDEKNYKNLSFSVNSQNNSILSKPDLILKSVSLDPNYPTPKIGDGRLYLKFVIKNIGGSINLVNAGNVIVGCVYDGLRDIGQVSKRIINNNDTVTIYATNVNYNVDLFSNNQSNYNMNCYVTVEPPEIESTSDNNYKNFTIELE